MTHTLHPEIEKAVTELAESVANEIYKVPTPAGIDFVKGVIKDELGPYLNMPQPIENEPLPEKQSTPQIEKINIAFLEGCGEQTVWEQPIIVKKINEIIDYINNTLPTSKDA